MIAVVDLRLASIVLRTTFRIETLGVSETVPSRVPRCLTRSPDPVEALTFALAPHAPALRAASASFRSNRSAFARTLQQALPAVRLQRQPTAPEIFISISKSVHCWPPQKLASSLAEISRPCSKTEGPEFEGAISALACDLIWLRFGPAVEHAAKRCRLDNQCPIQSGLFRSAPLQRSHPRTHPHRPLLAASCGALLLRPEGDLRPEGG